MPRVDEGSLLLLRGIVLPREMEDRDHDLEEMSGRAEMAVVPPLCPVEVIPFDFSQSADLTRHAEVSTRLWLRQGGLSRPGIPEEFSPHGHGNG